MKSYQEWKRLNIVEDLGYSLTPPNLPRTQTGLVGNELRTDAGQTARQRNGETERRFSQTVNNFKNKLTELPVPRLNKYQRGLGDLGMEMIGKTTFGS